MSKKNQQADNLKVAGKETKKSAILLAVFELLKPNNQVTTLEVKTYVRKNFPEFYTTQADVSQALQVLNDEGVLNYKDNGTYRTYYNPNIKAPKASKTAPQTTVKSNAKAAVAKTVNIVTTPSEVKGNHISRTQAMYFMQNNKGHFFTAKFITKKNNLRTINAQYLKDSKADLGYIKVRETGKLKKGEDGVRNVNLQTLEELTIGGRTFIVG